MSSITTTTSTTSNGTVTPSSTTSSTAPRSILRTSRKRSLETMDRSGHGRGSADTTTSASPDIMVDGDVDHDGHRGVVWDESNLTLNDRFTALQSFQTVTEPKTPYHHYSPSRSESESDDVDAGARAANGRYWNHKRVHSEGSGGSGSSIHYSDDAYDPDDAAGSESENDRRRREEFENRRKNHYKQTAKPIVLHKLQDEPLEDEDIDDHSRDEEHIAAYNGHADDEEDDEDDDDDDKEDTLRSSTRTQ